MPPIDYFAQEPRPFTLRYVHRGKIFHANVPTRLTQSSILFILSTQRSLAGNGATDARCFLME